MTLTPLPASLPPVAGGATPAASGAAPDPEFDALVAAHRETSDNADRARPASGRRADRPGARVDAADRVRHNHTNRPDTTRHDDPGSDATRHDPKASDGTHDGAGQLTGDAPGVQPGPAQAGGAATCPTTPTVTAPAATQAVTRAAGAVQAAGAGSPGKASKVTTAATTVTPSGPDRVAKTPVATPSTAQSGSGAAGGTRRAGTASAASDAAAAGPGARSAASATLGAGAAGAGSPPLSDAPTGPTPKGTAGPVASTDPTAVATDPASGTRAVGTAWPTVPVATGPGAAAAPAHPSASGGAPTAVPVPAQLQPSLARLVSRGDGTHRMSLRLHPAELGEVRLTVTVKDGAVDVALAAGPEAQDALRDGSAQLRSMLGDTGHTLGRLVVQDLPAAGGGPAAAGGQGGVGQQSPQGQASPQAAPPTTSQGLGQGSTQQQAFGHPGQHAGQHQEGRPRSGDPYGGSAPGTGRAPVVPPGRTAPSSTRATPTGLDVRI